MKYLLLTLLFLFSTELAQAQAVLRASDAYEYLQNQRAHVRMVVGEAKQPAPDSLRKGIRILQEALAYYHRPEIVALAKTSKSLYYRKSDLLFDLATLQGQLAEPEAAAASLQQLMTPEVAEVYASYILSEPALAAARQSPALKVALEKAMALHQVFDSKALATPYQPNLSPAEKAAGVSKMWMEAKYNFAYFDHIPTVDWD